MASYDLDVNTRMRWKLGMNSDMRHVASATVVAVRTVRPWCQWDSDRVVGPGNIEHQEHPYMVSENAQSKLHSTTDHAQRNRHDVRGRTLPDPA